MRLFKRKSKKNGEWINAFQDFKEKQMAEETYKQLSNNEYLSGVDKPVEITTKSKELKGRNREEMLRGSDE